MSCCRMTVAVVPVFRLQLGLSRRLHWSLHKCKVRHVPYLSSLLLILGLVIPWTSTPSSSSLIGYKGSKSTHATARAATGNKPQGEPQRGYRFGDLFINKLTGKDQYEFGDLSKWMDSKMKEKACELTGKDTYEFGDVARFVDSRVKEEVCKLTGKKKYEFGDVTREIARRVKEGDISTEDLSLLLRALLAFGSGLTPVAHILPVKMLLDVLTLNLELEMGNRASELLRESIANELDRRAKKAILGREEYKLGDITREQLQKSITSITGKTEYEFGDLSRAVAKLAKTNMDKATGRSTTRTEPG